MRKGHDYTRMTIVYICHDGDDNILLNKPSQNCCDGQGTQDPDGGGLKFGDTVENTLRKELEEEYCPDVIAYDFLGLRDVHREHNGEKTRRIALDFKVKLDRGCNQVLFWFSLDEQSDICLVV